MDRSVHVGWPAVVDLFLQPAWGDGYSMYALSWDRRGVDIVLRHGAGEHIYRWVLLGLEEIGGIQISRDLWSVWPERQLVDVQHVSVEIGPCGPVLEMFFVDLSGSVRVQAMKVLAATAESVSALNTRVHPMGGFGARAKSGGPKL